MGAREGALIIELIHELKQRGDVSMIVIAHNYVHVLEICDRMNLLRNGRIKFDKRTVETSVEELTGIVATEYRVKRRLARHGAHECAELVRELRVGAEALVDALRERPELGRAGRDLLADGLLELVRERERALEERPASAASITG